MPTAVKLRVFCPINARRPRPADQNCAAVQFYIARMLKRPDMDNQTRYGHVEKVQACKLRKWLLQCAAAPCQGFA